jgi:hypothetical protein
MAGVMTAVIGLNSHAFLLTSTMLGLLFLTGAALTLGLVGAFRKLRVVTVAGVLVASASSVG